MEQVVEVVVQGVFYRESVKPLAVEVKSVNKQAASC